MIQIDVEPVPAQIPRARRALRRQLDRERVETDHVGAVEMVANELLGAAFENGIEEPLVLSVETFTLLTSVRVRCPRNVELRDEPFGMRERVLGGFAFAWGKRARDDGSVDLWAELARPRSHRA